MRRTTHHPTQHNALRAAHRLIQRHFLTFCFSSLSVSGLNPFQHAASPATMMVETRRIGRFGNIHSTIDAFTTICSTVVMIQLPVTK